MAKLSADLFVLCDHASISQEQKLSIIGIFDNFFVADLPVNWPKMFLVAVLSGEPNTEYNLTLSLHPPKASENKFPDKEFKIVVGQNGKANVVTELVNFPLNAAGVHKIEIKNKDAKVAELEYRVTKTTATYGGQDLQGKKTVN